MGAWLTDKRPGTLRPVETGSIVGGQLGARTYVNPLIEPCPRCNARRYERCYKIMNKGMAGEFIFYLVQRHADRVKLTVSKHPANSVY